LIVKSDITIWALTPAILATQEAEIERISVPGQLRQKVEETPSQQRKAGMVTHDHHSILVEV
jgi:hypothetical protein